MTAQFSCGHYTQWILLAQELHTSNYIMVVTLVLLSLPSAVFNALVFIVIWKTPSLQTPSNIFLCNLAVSDFAVATFAAPLTIAWKLLDIYDKPTSATCVIAYIACFITITFGSLSFFTVTATAVDRHLALHLHLSYVNVVTTKRVIYACIVLWVISLILSSLTLIGVTEFTIAVNVSSFVCVIIMIYCSFKIFLVFRHHQNQIQCQAGAHPASALPNMSRYRKTVVNLLYVLLLFLVLYMPFTCAALAREILGDTVLTLRCLNISVTLAFLNSLVNPLVYCWRIEELRAGIKAILPAAFCSSTRQH